MTAPSIAQVLQASPAVALPGTWKLARGRAITLQPTADGILRIAHGRVWATVDGPHGGTPWDSGDHVLEVGRSMWIRAGQRVVIEAWSRPGSAYFSWDPALVPALAPAAARPRLNLAPVLQPLADLRLALALAARAAGRLVSAVGRLALDLAGIRTAQRGRRMAAC
jgi:hypothetical protein